MLWCKLENELKWENSIWTINDYEAKLKNEKKEEKKRCNAECQELHPKTRTKQINKRINRYEYLHCSLLLNAWSWLRTRSHVNMFRIEIKWNLIKFFLWRVIFYDWIIAQFIICVFVRTFCLPRCKSNQLCWRRTLSMCMRFICVSIFHTALKQNAEI